MLNNITMPVKSGATPRVAVLDGPMMLGTLRVAAALQALLDHTRVEWKSDRGTPSEDGLITFLARTFGRGEPGLAEVTIDADADQIKARTDSYLGRYCQSLIHLLKEDPVRAVDYVATQERLNQFRRNDIRQRISQAREINRQIEQAFALRLGVAKAIKLGSELLISKRNSGAGMIYGVAVDLIEHREDMVHAQMVFWSKEGVKHVTKLNGEKAMKIAENQVRLSEKVRGTVEIQLAALERDILKKSSTRKMAKLDRKIMRLNAAASSASKLAGSMTRWAKIAGHAEGALNLIFAANDAYEAVELIADGMGRE